MPGPNSPARRVLADKTPNASVRGAHDSMAKHYVDSSKSTEHEACMNHSVEMEVGRNVAPKAGQKRRLHEVDGTEEQYQPGHHRTGSTSPGAAPPTEPNSESDDGDFLTSRQTESTASTTSTSFHSSQEPVVTTEDQFGIEEEMSQQTLDKIHATPILHTPSQLRPPLRPALVTETSQDSLHMSSFIDFEPNEPEEDGLRMIPLASAVSITNRLGKVAMEEKAEALRTRLQLALYKVQTNQVSKPFSRLQQPRSSSPELPPLLPGLLGASPEGIVAAARARATQQKKPAVRNLNSLPIPTIVPTTYSARYMPNKQEQRLLIPNAMTDGLGEGAEASERSSTLILSQEDRTTIPKTPMQLSSPLRREEGRQLVESQGKEHFGGLTSSVVKGEAASGLLELMRAAVA